MFTKLKRNLLVPVVVPLLMLGLVPATEAVPPSGPVTIVTDIDFSIFPHSGTFVVTEGDDILGCLSGTFVDFARGPGVIQKIFTCSSGGGDFIFLFKPNAAHWEAWKATGAFVGLRGEGDFSLVRIPPMSGIETMTGVIHFEQ